MKPNVVWLQFDQLRTDALGCYGHSEFTPCTPNMDTIAEEGVRFTRCYCNSPVCCPSRTSQITGLYPEETGTYGNEANRDRFMPRYAIKSESPPRTIPEIFAAEGYRTAIFGRPEDIRRDLRDCAPWQTSNSEGHRVPLDPVSDTVSVPGSGVVFGGRFPEDRPYPSDGIADNAVAWMAGTEGFFASSRIPIRTREVVAARRSHLHRSTPGLVLAPRSRRRRPAADSKSALPRFCGRTACPRQISDNLRPITMERWLGSTARWAASWISSSEPGNANPP